MIVNKTFQKGRCYFMNNTNFKLNRFKILDGSWLKIIAVISMLLDHTAHMLQNAVPVLKDPILLPFGKSITIYYIMRMIGRLALPIFCFLIAEGFHHTRNRKKYGLNLLTFAIISEIPFNLLVSYGKHFIYLKGQNVFFTLFLGFLILYILESKINTIFKFVPSVLIIFLSQYMHLDYGTKGILLIVLLYYLRKQNVAKTLTSLPLLSGGYPAWSAFIFINLYNGKRGFIKGNFAKYAFYAFYPMHILLLYFVLKFI